MDARFQVTDAPRETAVAHLAETPLITIVWRALRAEHLRRAEERRRAEAVAQQMDHALADMAEQVYRLRRASRALDSTSVPPVVANADRLEEALRQAEVVIVAPEGEVFTAEWMELIENVAQQIDLDAHEARIAEIIAPAILCRGALLRMGKAVIAVPATQS